MRATKMNPCNNLVPPLRCWCQHLRFVNSLTMNTIPSQTIADPVGPEWITHVMSSLYFFLLKGQE